MLFRRSITVAWLAGFQYRDTSLVTETSEVREKIPLNMENREMVKISPDYDLLTAVMQKVEVFTDSK
jgi:hypothetical protein